MLGGSLIALCGVGFVVFDGTFNLGTNPLGDILTIAAAMLWAMYCIILKVIARRYSTFFILRTSIGLSDIIIQSAVDRYLDAFTPRGIR